ncbi:MAG: 23S rRNA (adenine(2503)-C(2))-methyltransferase RlmN [Bdellovibrio sp.]
MKKSFFGIPRSLLEAQLQSLGKAKFRSQQLFKWVYEKRIQDPGLMTNLSKEFRQEISDLFDFSLPRSKFHKISIDGTQKFLFELSDGLTIESVVIPSEDRLTLCVSSEVGCNMACKFCFTGKQKLKRRLTASEIVGQFVAVEDVLRTQNLKLTNIVFMGMGEPLDNCEAVFDSVEVLHEPFGRNFGRRKITVSTSGLVPEMWRVADARLRLAVSLNAPNDEIRDEVMPINKRHPLSELLQACREYTQTTGDRVTFEYVLLKGVTDSLDQARELWNLVKRIPCKINIIPFNEHPGSEFQRPEDRQVALFHQELMRLGAHVLLRKTMGRDIYAACGQLTSEFDRKPQSMDISNSRLGGPNGTDSRGWQSRL